MIGRVAGAAASAQFLVYAGLALLWWFGYQSYPLLFGLIGLVCIS